MLPILYFVELVALNVNLSVSSVYQQYTMIIGSLELKKIS